MLNNVLTHPRKVISVLHISPIEEDHRSLEQVFRHTNWELHKAQGLSSATAILKYVPVSVVLCECDLNPGNWKDLLQEISVFTVPPSLIVTSRLADDALWGEVLNLGGYDLLAKPFELAEVVHSVSLAWWHWSSRRALAAKTPAFVPASNPLQRSAAVGAS